MLEKCRNQVNFLDFQIQIEAMLTVDLTEDEREVIEVALRRYGRQIHEMFGALPIADGVRGTIGSVLHKIEADVTAMSVGTWNGEEG